MDMNPSTPIIWLFRVFTELLQLGLSLLPRDPFTTIINGIGDIPLFQTLIGWVNWFIPLGFVVQTFEIFLGVYVVYIAISVLLRLLKVFGG